MDHPVSIMENPAREKELGIYIHIPFCVRKCAYCDFLSAPADSRVREQYVRQLCREIEVFSWPASSARTGNTDAGEDLASEGRKAETAAGLEAYSVSSIFLGGGTPSVLNGEQIGRILQTVRKRFLRDDHGGASVLPRPEITVECNPGTLTEEKLLCMKRAGVNRLSLGLQSADDKELAALGRIHRWQDFLDSYYLAREHGFANINVDLMSALPGQSRESWQRTLENVLSLTPPPEHISAYSLIIEEQTPFFEKYHEDDMRRSRGETPEVLPSEEEEREMYEDTQRILSAHGLERYEISNYARPGFESVHNSGYWQRREYLGFGLGASSQTGRMRYKKTDSLADYLSGNFAAYDLHLLTREDEMEETMFLGLRMMQGVSERDFEERFGEGLLQVYGPVIESLQEQGLVRLAGGRLQLTKRGIDVSNVVLAGFLLDR